VCWKRVGREGKRERERERRRGGVVEEEDVELTSTFFEGFGSEDSRLRWAGDETAEGTNNDDAK
jgi:hypothetical protein